MERMIRVLMLCALWCHPGLAAESVRLFIDDPAGLKTEWPMTAGVPFPKGVLKSEENVRLVDGTGKEVPCQVDRTATWLDGSVRWALISFHGRTDGDYRMEYGEGVKRSPVAEGCRIEQADGGLTINTGPARFVLSKGDALIAQAELHGRPFLKDGGRGAYVVDNHGRLARLGGKDAEMQFRILQEGPMHTVVRTEGWYVVEREGGAPELPRQVARGIAWLHFHGGSPNVKIVHRLVLTADTNKVWFRDIGIDLPTAIPGPKDAAFDTSKAFDDKADKGPVSEGETIWMIQDGFPHFMSKTSHFALIRKSGDKETEIASGEACGEWCDLSGKDVGLTVVLRDFAEQFPKEFTITPNGITVHLWAGRCGRELDFRASTLVKEYWGKWCDYAKGGAEAVSKMASNAQSTAKTHEIILMPHAGAADVPTTARHAHAAAKRVLLYSDPAWACSTGALGLPILHKDTKRFPEQERLISDFFDRTVFPYCVFPMTGYIAWGCNPYLQYGKDKKTGEWYADWYRLRHLVDYNLRRNAWTLYARSGERKYFEYGERFDRFSNDMEMRHWDAGSDEKKDLKVKGGFSGGGDIHYPFYWGYTSDVREQDSSGTDIVNYLYQFYFTGDWHSREAAEDFGQAMKKQYDFDKISDGPSPFLIWRCLITLWTMDWDEEFGKMVRDIGRRIIDLNSPNGLYEKMAYGPLYKVSRNVSAIMDYWLLTEDEHAKKGFLKAVDYEYRFQRDDPPITYQNAAGMYYTMAYRFTKRKEYLQLANQSAQSALKQEKTTLAEELAPGLDKLDRLPYRGVHLNMHPLFSTPVVLKLLSEISEPIEPAPLLLKNFDSAQAWAAFEKPEGKAVSASMYFSATEVNADEPVILGPDSQPVTGVKIEKEQRIPYYADPGTKHFHVRITAPADLPAGTYRFGHSGRGPFTVMDADVDRMVLECPEGFWIGGGGLSVGEPFYFHVPDGTKDVRLFLGREVDVIRSDGSIAKDPEGKQVGDVMLPVEGKTGFWRLDFAEPALVRFRNLEPVVAFASTKRFFHPSTPLKMDIARPELPPPDAAFVPGVIGQALQLNGKDMLRYQRGAAHEDRSYDNFPGDQGTIEFYFRPNWSTVDFAVLGRKQPSLGLFNAGSVQFNHRCGQGPMTTTPYAWLDLLCRGPWGRPGQETLYDYGGQARHFFRAGEWIHIAGTWKIDMARKQPKERVEFFVFVNGGKRLRTWSYPREFTSWLPYRIGEIPEWIQIGPSGNGAYDELRVSDVVRYDADFAPPKTPFQPDDHTKALFHFDGSPDGVGAGGKKLTVEYKDRPS